VTYSELEKLAQEFMSCPFATRKQNILRRIYREDGEDALEVFSQLTGLSVAYIKYYGQLNLWQKARNRTRRGKDARVVFPRVTPSEAREIARSMAGGKGVDLYGRSGQGRQKKARRLQHYDPERGGLVVSITRNGERWPTKA